MDQLGDHQGLAALRRQVAHEANFSEEMRSLLEERVAALEELVAYMSLPKLLRLRSSLRRSAERYFWAAPDFTGQRGQYMSEEHVRRYGR
jgi:hypothetical protein